MAIPYRDAAHLATLLKQQDVPTGRTREADKETDGIVFITNDIHVQVPLRGKEPNVVVKTATGGYEFGDPKESLDDLLSDIRAALAGESISCDEDDELEAF